MRALASTLLTLAAAALLAACSSSSQVDDPVTPPTPPTPDTPKDDDTPADIMADTWVATDALGRVMPTSADTKQKSDRKRTVGIFYVTWHDEGKYNMSSPYNGDVTKVLEASPNARLDDKDPHWTEGSFHWGEPENGYFLSQDEYVIRKDISMLSDAGVDVLILDVTNAVMYWDEWKVLFDTMTKMKAEGNSVPKFCFWAFNGDVVNVVKQLYTRIYAAGQYKDLWFEWARKPLLLYNATPSVDANGSGHNTSAYPPEVLTFFTLRNMWWGYYNWNGKRYVGTEDNWSFGYELNDYSVAAMSPKNRAATHNGRLEQMAVTPAQHAISTTGKCWRVNTKEPALNDRDMPEQAYVPWLGRTVTNPEGYGIYFQDRWDEALAVDPDFIYINDWNEWTAGKYQSGKALGSDAPGPTEFLGRTNPFYFVDQYNAEFNRTIQPMKGGYTDNYYMQMVQNIRRYKGVRAIPENKGLSTIAIDGDFADWDAVAVTYYDTKGDVAHRNHNGYGGNHYTNDSGRNDIVKSKVAVGDKTVSFYAETASALSPSSDKNWMLLLINADCDQSTGWEGYDYIVNYKIKGDGQSTVMRYDSASQSWTEVGEARFAVKDNRLELCFDKSLIGISGNSATFDFKWADNPASLTDAISLCTDGDTAPNRRFNYRFIWKK